MTTITQTHKPVDAAKRELTSKQRVIVRLMEGSIRQLGLGTRDEQWTAAILSLARDAIVEGYQDELVRFARKWAAAREVGADDYEQPTLLDVPRRVEYR